MEENDRSWDPYGLWSALGAFLAIRALILIVAWTAPQDRARAPGPPWWSSVRTLCWDGGHYAYILEYGYPLQNGGLPEPPHSDAVAFFPAYPLLAWPLTLVMNSHAALVTLTHVASLLAMVFLYLWARRRFDARVAFWCVVSLSVYPPAMFFSSGYADGLLVLWVALALWLLDRQQVWAAAAASALATATRPTGLCLAVVVVLWAIRYGPRLPWPTWLLRLTAIGLISVSGLIAFQLYLWHHYDRPDAFVAVQKSWKPRSDVPRPLLCLITFKPVIQPAFKPFKYAARGLLHLALWHPEAARVQFGRLLEPASWNSLFNLILVVASAVGLVRPGRIPRILFLLPILVFLEAWAPDPYRGSRMIGIARYQLMALPAFLLLANWLAQPQRACLRYALCAGMLALQFVYVRQFVNWIMVG